VAEPAPPPLPSDPVVEQLLAAARADAATGYARLSALCDGFGPRPTGSPALDKAINWGLERFREDGLQNVRAEPVMVPVWRRGNESLRLLTPYEEPLAMLGLGGSVGTKKTEASVVVLRSFEELGPQVKGKIVLYNVPMIEGTPQIAQYGSAVAYRSRGASRAAEFGAVAALVRSVTTRSLYTPHTGGMGYAEGGTKIPAAAITTEDADRIARLVASGVDVRLRLQMDATSLPDAPSANAIAEIPGTTDEIIVVGGHIDSWDVGTGAHDDGAGIVQTIEAMRQIQRLGIKPKRTIRAVLFTNEEMGLRGGVAYAKAHAGEKHVAAVETDLGAGRPRGWNAKGNAADLAWLDTVLAPTGIGVVGEGGGADIGPLGETGVLMIGLAPDDTRYFDVHHTEADTVDKVDPAALAEGSAQLAALLWRLANVDRP
jgi:carboxypeptidase Q